MADPHKLRPSQRIPHDLREAAQEKLKDQNDDEPWTLNDVVVASVAMFVKRPKSVLKMLAPFRPPRKRGRPRKGG